MGFNHKKSGLTLSERIYNRMLALSTHRHAKYYLGSLTFCEAIFFPIPPDVMLAPMVLAKPSAVWRLAFFVTLMSVLGGVVGYIIGFYLY